MLPDSISIGFSLGVMVARKKPEKRRTLIFIAPASVLRVFERTRAAAIKRKNDRNVIKNRALRRSENCCENTQKSYAKAIDATKPVHSPEIFQITPFRPPKTMPRASWGEPRRAKSGSDGPRSNAKHWRGAKRSTDSPQKSAKARPRARKQAEGSRSHAGQV